MSENNDVPELGAVLELYRHAEERRGKQISRIWETMKLTTTIVFGLFTATITILGFLLREGFPLREQSWIIMFLPIFSTGISIWSLTNVRRQYNRFLEIITWISKVERYLDLHIEITEDEKRYFSSENHLVPERFFESESFRTGDAFIKSKLRWCSDTMYGSFAKLHILYVILATSNP